MTLATALPRDQAIIDRYVEGASYKTLAREFRHGEHRIRAMIYTYAPEIMRTRSEQAALAAKMYQANRTFCPEDLGLTEIGPCAACGIPLVGRRKTNRLQTCGLCQAARAA